MTDLAVRGSLTYKKPGRTGAETKQAARDKTYNTARPKQNGVIEVLNLSNLPEWHDRAACKGKATDLWFPGQGESSAAAKQVCWEECPVREDCLDYGIATRQEEGVWGGFANRELRHERQRRRDGLEPSYQPLLRRGKK